MFWCDCSFLDRFHRVYCWLVCSLDVVGFVCVWRVCEVFFGVGFWVCCLLFGGDLLDRWWCFRVRVMRGECECLFVGLVSDFLLYWFWVWVSWLIRLILNGVFCIWGWEVIWFLWELLVLVDVCCWGLILSGVCFCALLLVVRIFVLLFLKDCLWDFWFWGVCWSELLLSVYLLCWVILLLVWFWRVFFWGFWIVDVLVGFCWCCFCLWGLRVFWFGVVFVQFVVVYCCEGCCCSRSVGWVWFGMDWDWGWSVGDDLCEFFVFVLD